MRSAFRPALVALALALAAAPAAAQRACPGGAPRPATLGVGVLQCVGGSCAVDVRTREGLRHDFSTEPRVWYVRWRGPAAGLLEEGDAIVTVDGALITTPEGGRRLANLRPGVPVKLGVRRGDAETEVEVVPTAGCGAPRLVVSAREGKPEWPLSTHARWRARTAVSGDANPHASVRFGMELECGECGWRREEGGWRWHSAREVVVHAVEPGGPADRAGIRTGDVVLSIGGHALTTAGGGGFMSALRPGQPVRVVVRRGRDNLLLTVRPVAVHASR